MEQVKYVESIVLDDPWKIMISNKFSKRQILLCSGCIFGVQCCLYMQICFYLDCKKGIMDSWIALFGICSEIILISINLLDFTSHPSNGLFFFLNKNHELMIGTSEAETSFHNSQLNCFEIIWLQKWKRIRDAYLRLFIISQHRNNRFSIYKRKAFLE